MLLTTKLFAPRRHPRLIARPRLLAKLIDGPPAKLILVSAPAGSGKTTLVVEWMQAIAARQPPAAVHFTWLSLDESENDPIRFVTYLVAALQQAVPQVGQTIAPMLERAVQTPPTLETLMTVVINDLVQVALEVVLVLDDYHVIQTPAIHNALTFFLDNTPPGVQVVITTRADPPLPLARWRASMELLELRDRELRFSTAETAEFLRQQLGIDVQASDVAALEQRTEGWIAGLQLVALSLHERTDLAAFIRAFTGSHAYIVDYLVEEVLDRQRPQVVQFLLQTSILTRLNAALCDAVLQRHDSQAMLVELDRGNLFLQALDNQRQWYRYHHLFADVLRHRSQQSEPQLVRALHQRASIWYAQQNLLHEAIDHGLAAGDLVRVQALFEANVPDLLKRSEHETVQHWLRSLPPEQVRSSPHLALASAAVLVLKHDLAVAETFVDAAEQAIRRTALEPGLRTTLMGQAAALRANIALNYNDAAGVVTLAQAALAELPAENVTLRGQILFHLGCAQIWLGNLTQAGVALAEAAYISEATQDLHTTLLALYNQGAVQFVMGQLQQAEQLFNQALQLLASRGIQALPTAGIVHGELGELLYEQNRLDEAEVHITEALRRGEYGGLPRTQAIAYQSLVRLALARKDWAEAHALNTRAEQLVQQHHLPPRYATPIIANKVRIWLAEGALDAVRTWAAQVGLPAPEANDRMFEPQYLALARALIATGATEAAGELLIWLRCLAEADGRVLSLVEILALQAWGRAIAQPHALEPAFTVLDEALALAAPAKFVRTFADLGAAMQQLLAAYCQQNSNSPRRYGALYVYVEQLLAAFGDDFASPPAPAPLPLAAPSLVEPLTERELEVLRLVAVGHSDRQIAAALIVAIGTVKRHLNNIYSKLGVHSRTQALAVAKAAGILEI